MRLLKDALTGITVLIIITAIITLIAMAAAPTLTDGNVDPSSGTTADLFNFSVTFTDADNDTATYVKVIIDGTEHELSETDPNDINTTDGKEYSITGLSFTSGTYSYNFTAADANDTASPLEGGTFTVTEAVVAPSVIEYFPSDNPSTPNGTEQKFGVKFDQEVDVTWEINDIEVHNETLVPAETWANYTNSTAGVGEYTVRASGSNENGSDIAEWTWTVTDSTPPASVTNLSVAGRGMTWINWTWDNPSDDDFDHNEIHLNETSKGDLPKSQNYYNATGLVPDTNYIITVYAIDSVGNKDTGMSDENTTLPNTPTGDVNLTFGNVAVNFTDVTVAGNTTVVGSITNPANHYFAKVSDYYYYIETTADFSSVNISIPYNAGDIDESLVKLYHYSAGSWNEAANISVDTTNKKVSGDVSSLSTFAAGVPQRPIITINKPDPDEMPETSEGDELEFNISVDQIVTIQWYVNGTKVSGSHDKENITLSKSAGTYIINATASNDNGSADNASWILTVHPKFYSTGYRIWDANYDMSTTYTWTPQSFSGFFYDLEEDVSSETMTIHLDSKTDRFIDEGELEYKSVPVSVYFDYDSWGKYNLTGFMAEKYFAAYIDDTEIDDVDPEDLLSHGYLSKILIDEGGESSEKHRVTIGTTLPLEEGYALKAVDVDAESAIVLFVLLKDGEEVDTGEPVGSGEDYIYTQKIGSKKDVPIIIVHVESVFHGRETDAAFIRGVFQISENPIEIDSGDQYGIMEVKSKSGGITMENEDSFDLDEDSIVDIMGDIKFKVADDSDTLRFAPFVEGLSKLRGTVSRGEPSFEWTPLNFEGLYYDFDTGFGSETLNATDVDVGSRSIQEGDLVYTTVPVNIEFDYANWGRYDLVGFMGGEYFAAYNNTDITGEDLDEDLLSHGYLPEVLIDEGGESSEKHTITIGSTLTLKEGYVLKAVDVDAESAIVLFVLLKDGEEVDTGEPVGSGEDYIYTQKIGSKKDVPIIIVHVESVFHGRETDAAFIRGVFQISENPLEVKSGDEYGIMEVKSKSGGIRMENTEEVVDLEAGDIIDVMGEIRFEVADDPDNLRYYPFITVDVEEESASTLKINAPATAMERDLITIQVTTGTNEIILGADVEFDGENIGTTDSNGEITHTLARVGTSTINATKVGYESASKTITVEEYVETQLRIESVSEILQTEEFELTVTVGGEPLSGASILVDNSSVGTTDASGRFNYTFPASGSHTVKAEKTGYIAAEKTINVIKPYSKFEATAFNITPVNVTLKEPVAITAKITNTGNIRGEDEVELKINGTAVDSRNLTLEPGEETSVNFTFVESKSPGTYYAEILNKGGEFHVEKKPMGWLLYAGIATVIGLIVVYLVTMRPGFGTPGTGTGGVGSTRDKLALKLSQLKMKVKK